MYMMTPTLYYIFRSSELFFNPDNSLPTQMPGAFEGLIADSLDLTLDSLAVKAVLLRDGAPRSAVVTGSVSGPGVTVAPASGQDPASVPGTWIRLRAITVSDDPAIKALSGPASRALGILNWHDSTRYCGRCGAPLTDHPSELARLCPSCSHVTFPRISPAIIVLVRKEGKILLARHAHRNQDVFACIAGFLEHGETLEECVAREVREEIGIEVTNVTYAGSQSWPYPDQHMVAFYADWAAGEIAVDGTEIAEARWFDPLNLPNTPMPGTVAWKLIHGAMRASSRN